MPFRIDEKFDCIDRETTESWCHDDVVKLSAECVLRLADLPQRNESTHQSAARALKIAIAYIDHVDDEVATSIMSSSAHCLCKLAEYLNFCREICVKIQLLLSKAIHLNVHLGADP